MARPAELGDELPPGRAEAADREGVRRLRRHLRLPAGAGRAGPPRRARRPGARPGADAGAGPGPPRGSALNGGPAAGAALVGLPEHLPVVVPAAPQPGRADVDPQVVVDVGFGTHLPGGTRLPSDPPDLVAAEVVRRCWRRRCVRLRTVVFAALPRCRAGPCSSAGTEMESRHPTSLCSSSRAPSWSAERAPRVWLARSGGSSSANLSCLRASSETLGSAPARSAPKRSRARATALATAAGVAAPGSLT